MNKDKETQEIIDNLTKGIEAAKDMRSVLQAQLAEAEKPKLRHGDCSLSRMGEPAVFIGNGREAVAYYEDGHSEPCGEWQNGTYAIDGRGFRFNIFKEMQAQSEPLRNFVVDDDVKVYLDHDNDLIIEQESDDILINSIHIHDFILKLRRMELKMKMDEAKQQAGGKE